MWIHPKARLLQPLERLPMSRKRLPRTTDKKVVNKHVELAPRHQTRIELSNRTRRGIARIGKSRLALFLAFRVRLFKHVARNENLAAHFDVLVDQLRVRFEPQRNTANRARILRY